MLIALVVGGIAASGKYSLNATNVLLFIAWASGVFAITQLGLSDRHLKIFAELGVGAVAVFISFLVTQRHRRSRKSSGPGER